MDETEYEQDPVLFECDFSSHNCGMKDEIVTPAFTWTRIRWNTPSDETGPDGDASYDRQGFTCLIVYVLSGLKATNAEAW